MTLSNHVTIVTCWGVVEDAVKLSDLGEPDELYVCPVCGNVENLDNYDILGADPGTLFCNQCSRQVSRPASRRNFRGSRNLQHKPQRATRKTGRKSFLSRCKSNTSNCLERCYFLCFRPLFGVISSLIAYT